VKKLEKLTQIPEHGMTILTGSKTTSYHQMLQLLLFMLTTSLLLVLKLHTDQTALQLHQFVILDQDLNQAT
jgi:hypothetical protein